MFHHKILKSVLKKNAALLHCSLLWIGIYFELIDKYPLYVHFPRIKIMSGSDVG